MTGYASAEYAQSLAEFGTPLALPASGGWLLARELPAGEGRDLAGCYPLTCCRDWTRLSADLANLPGDVVSVALVADPAAPRSPELLLEAFPDLCYHYKDHYFTDLSQPLTRTVSTHHQRNVRQACRSVQVERAAEAHSYLPVWNDLYRQLVQRHAITGIAAFSPRSFAGLMQVPGLRAFTASTEGRIVGMLLWLVAGEIAYYHLAAYNEAGYTLKASFALFWQSLEALAAEGVGWAALGSGAGTHSTSSGLTRFKAGWATETRPAWFCGRIVNRQRYNQLSAGCSGAVANYFPIYRAGERKHAA
jgi:hypothetical protein